MSEAGRKVKITTKPRPFAFAGAETHLPPPYVGKPPMGRVRFIFIRAFRRLVRMHPHAGAGVELPEAGHQATRLNPFITGDE